MGRTMDESFFDEEQERIQKALNEAKKRELEQKYGAHFSYGQSKLPPEAELKWLNYIEEFERQYQNVQQVAIREVLGFPTFTPVDEIPRDRLEPELNIVLELLGQHDIVVDCLAEVSDEDLYRFIATELIDEEIDDMKIEGMRHCFIYEEFHPNDEYDAKSAAEDFLWNLFERHENDVVHCFAEDEIYDPTGQRISVADAEALVCSFFRRYAAFTLHEFQCYDCALDGEYATVRLEGGWSGVIAESMAPISHMGLVTLKLKKSPYGGYDVTQAIIPGFVA